METTNGNVPNNDLKEIQGVLLEMLKDFDAFCKREGLVYTASGGTLLGAIRHHGFIPWDDDVDLCMMRDEYEKLLAIPPERFPEGYYMHSHKSDESYHHPFAKFRKAGTVWVQKTLKDYDTDHTAWLDIFPMDYCKGPKNPMTKLKASWIHILTEAYRRGRLRELGRPAKTDGLRTRFMDLLARGDLNKLYEHRDKLAMSELHKHPDDPDKCYIISYDDIYNDITIMGDSMPNILVPFEDTLIPCSRIYDHYLTVLYGDYMTPPSIEERRNHGAQPTDFSEFLKDGEPLITGDDAASVDQTEEVPNLD